MSKEDRGFASMDIDRRRAIASLGGRAAHAKGTAHQWTKEEASAAGRKGGAAAHINRGAKTAAILPVVEASTDGGQTHDSTQG